jgi:hypothetical protein
METGAGESSQKEPYEATSDRCIPFVADLL